MSHSKLLTKRRFEDDDAAVDEDDGDSSVDYAALESSEDAAAPPETKSRTSLVSAPTGLPSAEANSDDELYPWKSWSHVGKEFPDGVKLLVWCYESSGKPRDKDGAIAVEALKTMTAAQHRIAATQGTTCADPAVPASVRALLAQFKIRYALAVTEGFLIALHGDWRHVNNTHYAENYPHATLSRAEIEAFVEDDAHRKLLFSSATAWAGHESGNVWLMERTNGAKQPQLTAQQLQSVFKRRQGEKKKNHKVLKSQLNGQPVKGQVNGLHHVREVIPVGDSTDPKTRVKFSAGRVASWMRFSTDTRKANAPRAVRREKDDDDDEVAEGSQEVKIVTVKQRRKRAKPTEKEQVQSTPIVKVAPKPLTFEELYTDGWEQAAALEWLATLDAASAAVAKKSTLTELPSPEDVGRSNVVEFELMRGTTLSMPMASLLLPAAESYRDVWRPTMIKQRVDVNTCAVVNAPNAPQPLMALRVNQPHLFKNPHLLSIRYDAIDACLSREMHANGAMRDEFAAQVADNVAKLVHGECPMPEDVGQVLPIWSDMSKEAYIYSLMQFGRTRDSIVFALEQREKRVESDVEHEHLVLGEAAVFAN